MKGKYCTILLGCMALLVCGIGNAATMEFQQGVSPDASYQHDGVHVGTPNSAWAAGAAQTFALGNTWNNAANSQWGLFRYDLSALSGMVITGAYLEITSTQAAYMDVGAGSDIPDELPETLTINMYQIKSANNAWIEGTGTAVGTSPNGTGEVNWPTEQNDVLCWPVSGCTAAGLYPEGHPKAPAVDTYNTAPDIIGSGVSTNTSANDYSSNIVVTLNFNEAGLAYLQGVVDGTPDAGFLVAPPEELLNVGPTYYGIVLFGMDDNDNAALRPKLVVEYEESNEETLVLQDGVSPSAEYTSDGCFVIHKTTPENLYYDSYSQLGKPWTGVADGVTVGYYLARFDLSPLPAGATITSAKFVSGGMIRAAGTPSTWPDPHTYMCWPVTAANAGWVGSTVTFESLSDTTAWANPDAGLFPKGHPDDPGVAGDYNVGDYASPIATGTVSVSGGFLYADNGTGDTVLGAMVDCPFNAEGIAYLQSAANGGTDPGFLFGAGPELVDYAKGGGTYYVGMINQNASIDGEATPNSHPKLVIKYTLGGATTVPDVSGMSQSEATAALEGAGYVVDVVEESSDTVPAGGIIRTEPAAGSELAAGETVTLVISSGSASGLPVAGLLGLALLGVGCAGSAIAVIRKRISR